MTNDEAVRVLREVVQKPGPIKLVVAKCWDPNPKGMIRVFSLFITFYFDIVKFAFIHHFKID